MSEHDDTLLDEDLGDDEYDLGNDEEEALLADDYEVERQNSYKGEEETDDVLDLGVTDALDDLDAEDENIEFSRSKTDKNNDNDFYDDGERSDVRSKYYEQDENNEYKSEQARQYENQSAPDSVNVSNNIGKGDLREKLQKNVQKVYVGNGQGLEDDDCEEARERRNRFQNERTIVSPKMNSNIPDSLENVVTSEPTRSSFRGRGRGRISRGATRGGRFNTQNVGNFNPRFPGVRNQQQFDNQQPVCRPPLIDTRPPFFLGAPNNIPNQQILCQQANPQVQPFQHYPPNGPLQGPTHFLDNRGQFGPNQFQGQVGPRQLLGPRPDYGPRPALAPGSMQPHVPGPGQAQGHGQGPPYNVNSCPGPNQPAYVHGPPGPFQNSPASLLQDNPPRFVQTNSGPLLQVNPPGSLLGNPGGLPPPGGPAGLLQGNQSHPMQGFPRQQHSSQGPPINHPNVQMPNQPPYENRPPFQEPPFEGRPAYDSRPSYSDQVAPTNQFSGNPLPGSQQPPPNVPNVALPPGHKILINPHFRGAVQPTSDARLVWDSAQQQAPVSSQVAGGQFSQSYQGQSNYSQGQQGPPYQQNYPQKKSDDPYMYFSDVWQENKPQKTQSSSPCKQYSSESNYSRDSSYDCGSKYKSDSQWEQKDSYQEEHRGVHQNYRDRELPPKARSDHLSKSRPMSSNTYREGSYDHNHTQKSPSSRSLNPATRGPPRLPQKRPSESLDRPLRDISPKRIKPTNRNLQEVRTVETLNDVISEKKEEDSDPEMQEYRKKMEEQKRLREKILREKENRRKLAAMEKQNEEAKNEAASESTQDTKPVSALMGVVKDAVTSKGHPGVSRGRARPASAQTTEATERASGVRIVRTIQSVPLSDTDSGKGKEGAGIGADGGGQTIQPQSGTRRVVIQKPLPNSQKVATTIQKTVSNLQKGPGQLPQKVAGAVQNQVTGLKKVNLGQKGGVTTQRIVTQTPVPGTLSKTVINVQEVTSANAQKVVVNTQNNQRVILQKAPVQQRKVPEIKTNTVKLENLAASTSEAKIRSMCQGIGTIESIHMGERSATIVFKTQSAAMVFHKKYQRKMVDLSLITVRLVPQSSGIKTTGALVKVS